MKNLVGNGKYFKFNSKFNWKPMEIFKNRCNVACVAAVSFPSLSSTPVGDRTSERKRRRAKEHAGAWGEQKIGEKRRGGEREVRRGGEKRNGL